ncbi:MAG TPA: hypothetical protein VFS12_00940 [Terriglobia bacterium]|nr:hypothetical protein [Terriglobia bacterium]
MNELFWAEMEPAKNFIQQEPDAGLPATEQTEVRIAFDDKDLYLGIICFDRQPENIVVTQNRRDANLADTDSIEILLDTSNDKQNAVVFGTSPTGIEYDGQVSKAGQTRGSGGTNVRAGGASGNSGAHEAVLLPSTSTGMRSGGCALKLPNAHAEKLFPILCPIQQPHPSSRY